MTAGAFLQRAVCREKQLAERYGAETADGAAPAYDVPSWLAPHFCDAANWASEGLDEASWLEARSADAWEQVLEAPPS